MKKSFINFWKRNLAFFHLAIVTNLEYRLNYFADAIIQPLLAVLIDVTLWLAIFHSSGATTIGGFGQNDYLAYVIWAAFITRITMNWLYEMKMIEEIEMGTVNSLLTRPISFYQYYLSQFMGYKIITTVISMLFPVAAILLLRLPTDWLRLLPALALATYYLLLVHTISFCVATLAFKFNKVSSVTHAKNLTLWLLSGELFPLDLLPEPWKHWFIAMPFSSAVYIPVAYLTGRADVGLLYLGFASTSAGLAVFGAIGYYFWQAGLRTYSGTGA